MKLAPVQNPLLPELLEACRQHIYHNVPPQLDGMGVFHCHQRQSLRAVPIHQPSLILVLCGEKHLHHAGSLTRCTAGKLLLLPAMCEVQLENIPDLVHHEYLALCIPIAPQTITRFINGFSTALNWREQTSLLCAQAPDTILLSLLQRLQWSRAGTGDELLLELRQQELLAHCAQQGWLGHLLRDGGLGVAQRVASLVSGDCARDWRIADACNALAMSESSLRRELQRENTGFREILEQVRLTTALGMLQGTRRNVAEIAGQVGYDSPSRFAARFRQRFGMSPGEVKSSREKLTDSGAMLVDPGANILATPG